MKKLVSTLWNLMLILMVISLIFTLVVGSIPRNFEATINAQKKELNTHEIMKKIHEYPVEYELKRYLFEKSSRKYRKSDYHADVKREVREVHPSPVESGPHY